MEQIIDIRTILRYLGVRLIGSSYMIGDNESVALSSMNFNIKLHKRNNSLYFHGVRESIAVGICRFHDLLGKLNPVDIISKH